MNLAVKGVDHQVLRLLTDMCPISAVTISPFTRPRVSLSLRVERMVMRLVSFRDYVVSIPVSMDLFMYVTVATTACSYLDFLYSCFDFSTEYSHSSIWFCAECILFLYRKQPYDFCTEYSRFRLLYRRILDFMRFLWLQTKQYLYHLLPLFCTL